MEIEQKNKVQRRRRRTCVLASCDSLFPCYLSLETWTCHGLDRTGQDRTGGWPQLGLVLCLMHVRVCKYEIALSLFYFLILLGMAWLAIQLCRTCRAIEWRESAHPSKDLMRLPCVKEMTIKVWANHVPDTQYQMPNLNPNPNNPRDGWTAEEHRSKKGLIPVATTKDQKKKKRCHLQYQNFLLLSLSLCASVPLCLCVSVSFSHIVCVHVSLLCSSLLSQTSLRSIKGITHFFLSRLCRQLWSLVSTGGRFSLAGSKCKKKKKIVHIIHGSTVR